MRPLTDDDSLGANRDGRVGRGTRPRLREQDDLAEVATGVSSPTPP